MSFSPIQARGLSPNKQLLHNVPLNSKTFIIISDFCLILEKQLFWAQKEVFYPKEIHLNRILKWTSNIAATWLIMHLSILRCLRCLDHQSLLVYLLIASLMENFSSLPRLALFVLSFPTVLAFVPLFMSGRKSI